MRIAVWHNLPSGGGKRALYDHVRGLVERGHQAEAWCPPTANRSYLPLADLVTEHVTPLRWNTEGPSLAKLQPIYWNMHSKIAAMDEHCRLCAEQMRAGGFDYGTRHRVPASAGSRRQELPGICAAIAANSD